VQAARLGQPVQPGAGTGRLAFEQLLSFQSLQLPEKAVSVRPPSNDSVKFRKVGCEIISQVQSNIHNNLSVLAFMALMLPDVENY